ncbi:hypothetical protein EBR77_02845 [bacterium]|nr:hypothetical protein [bacterium]NBX78064.1 hypothetical protein [bacterium]
MKNILFLGLFLVGFGCLRAADAKSKKETSGRWVTQYVQNPDGSWKVKRVQVPGQSELSVRPDWDAAQLTAATLAAISAQETSEQDQLKD